MQGVTCLTITHSNIQSLIIKLEALAEYATRENIFTSSNLTTSSANSANTLLQTLSFSLPSILSRVGNVTMEGLNYDDQVNETGLQCVTEYCQTKCSVCQASCQLHRLKHAVNDLIGVLKADWVGPCETCVPTAVQAMAMETRNIVDRTGGEVIPNTPFYCIQMVLLQLPFCGQPLQLLERLKNLTSLVNSSLSVFNESQSSDLQLVVQRLTDTILPTTRAALETLEGQGCPELTGFDTGTDCEPVPSSQIAEEVISLLPGSGCGLQQDMVVGLRVFNLLRFNYNHFFDRLVFLGLLS